MKKFSFIIILCGVLPLLFGCDDGRIYEKNATYTDGKVVRLEGSITGLSSWPENYNVAIAGFAADDDYAVISKVINNMTDEGDLDITLSGIPENVKTVEFCILNRLRKRVLTLQSEDISNSSERIIMDIGSQDISMFTTIQHSLLDVSCIACHGASTFAAANLNLTEGKSYAQMVNRNSSKVAGLNIVTPGDADNSVLHQVLNTNISASWHQNHADMLNKERTANILTMIDDWISYGAKE